MSSIAYITDKQMIEFHRLNGHSTINFWRPSSGKRFTDFNPGDLLFFLAKGTEKRSGEKGIVGYGRYVSNHQHSFKQMWSTFGTLNGYPNEESFREAILRMSKTKKIQGRYGCLELTDIVFFQAPVYLSEFGLKISKTIESYIYLDKEDPNITTKVLMKANEIGVDAWSSAVSRYAPASSVFEDDLNRHLIQLSLTSLPTMALEKDRRRQSALLSQLLSKIPTALWLDTSHQALCVIDSKGIKVICAISCLKTQLKERVVYEIGKRHILETNVCELEAFGYNQIDYEVVLEEKPTPEMEWLLESHRISHRVLKASATSA